MHKQYVSALVSRQGLKQTNKPAVILALYGVRGGTVTTAEIDIEQATALRDQLNTAIAELMALAVS